ncbi:MAG: fibronectin type III domain-containing protein [Acidobacteria bacterium]|nr:fibronectin type III domain-containing protein [Acidobacteriota bacterium]
MAAVALGLCAFAACGKKGPPLAPLRFVPLPVTDVKARRSGHEVRLQFVLPTANVEGPGPVALDRLEVFAVTVAAESANPPNRDLLTSRYLVGTIPVKPPRKEGEPEPTAEGATDQRPAAGDVTSFVEELNEAKLKPQITTPAPPEVVPPAATGAAAPATAAAPANEPAVVRRVYAVRGLTRGGRPGQPSARVILPLVELPLAPDAVAVKFTETAVTVSWTAPAAANPAAAAPVFNIYRPGASAPLNPVLLTSPAFERTGVAFGTEECFVVRTAVVIGTVSLESLPSAAQCVTPSDIFAPAAPKGLSAVGSAGTISLIWEANTESDIAGYLILRGEVPGDTLQALTATPIRETTYQDTTVKSGVRYGYVVVAVDRATPPNTSPQSARVEESAR